MNDGIPPSVQWALDETSLRYCPKEQKMHVADQSKQVCLGTSRNNKQLTAIRCVSRSGEGVCMQIITRRKIALPHAYIPPSCVLRDALYQDQNDKNFRMGATLQGLLRNLAPKVGRIREQHHLLEDLLVIIIMQLVASQSQEARTPIKGHVH